MRDRRVTFFIVAAVAGGVLYPVADPEHRWVTIAVAVVYSLLALAVWLDAGTRANAPPRYRSADSVERRE